MPDTATIDRVTLHLKTDRPVRDRLLGSLRADGITMQDFFDALMQMLVTNPDRLQEVKAWTADLAQAAKKPRGRPARVA